MSVPEAAVDEEAKAVLGEDEIGGSRKVSSMESESEAEFVSSFSNADFGGGVLSPNRSHDP